MMVEASLECAVDGSAICPKGSHRMANTVIDGLTAECNCLSGSEWRRLRSNLITLFME